MSGYIVLEHSKHQNATMVRMGSHNSPVAMSLTVMLFGNQVSNETGEASAVDPEHYDCSKLLRSERCRGLLTTVIPNDAS